MVAGIDSKIYLRDFSSIEKPLTTKQLARDYVDVAKALSAYASLDSGTPVYIYGWSLGAGFAIAVGADVETRSNWAGIISIGLPKQNQLVSGVGGNHSNLNVEAHYGFQCRCAGSGHARASRYDPEHIRYSQSSQSWKGTICQR